MIQQRKQASSLTKPITGYPKRAVRKQLLPYTKAKNCIWGGGRKAKAQAKKTDNNPPPKKKNTPHHIKEHMAFVWGLKVSNGLYPGLKVSNAPGCSGLCPNKTRPRQAMLLCPVSWQSYCNWMNTPGVIMPKPQHAKELKNFKSKGWFVVVVCLFVAFPGNSKYPCWVGGGDKEGARNLKEKIN